MKKVFSLVAVALLTVSVLFTACRENTSAGETKETTAPAEAAPAEAAPAQDAGQLTAPAADTTQKAQ
ncbi:MAG: hypothetical protein HY842_12055 [Bacteroidetes bacterium]|nr:hypothetical protein [Bacteroidota bacterium]